MTRGRDRRRLDQLLVERGLAPSRTRAAALVMAGRVRVDGRPAGKQGVAVDPDVAIEIVPGPRWVSRGGSKLASALARFAVTVAGRDALDVGASTGGFTHVLLDAGAARVISLDVGRGQLDWSLRKDSRVSVLDGINARYLTPDDLPFRPSLAVVDVSFISLRHVLPAVVACVGVGGEVVALVKPQFELGRGRVGRGGIVRARAARREALEATARFACGRGWGVSGVTSSPIAGAGGNIEFFLHLRIGDPDLAPERLAAAVDAAVDEVPGGPA